MNIRTDVLPEAKFKIFTGLLKAYENTEDGTLRLAGVASSTTRDHHGDNMEETALRDMEAAANNNMTIFLNHSYAVPEDVAGSVERAAVTQRGYDSDGNPNWDLDMDIAINRENDRAVKSWNAIKNGTKLGLSIGAMIPEGGATRDKETGGLSISRVTLLETSIVSIPANPRSWISNAVKALSLASGESAEPTEDLIIIESTAPETVTEPVGATIEVETSVEDVDVTASQEAETSEPENEDGAEPEAVIEGADLDLDLDPVMKQSVEGVLALLETTTAKLVDTRDALQDEKRARKEAEEQRDEAAATAKEVFAQARAIFDKLADTPMGRKTSFKQQQNDFDSLDGIYSEQFRQLLKHGG